MDSSLDGLTIRQSEHRMTWMELEGVIDGRRFQDLSRSPQNAAEYVKTMGDHRRLYKDVVDYLWSDKFGLPLTKDECGKLFVNQNDIRQVHLLHFSTLCSIEFSISFQSFLLE